MNEEFQPHNIYDDDDYMRMDGRYAIKTPQFSVTTKPRSRPPDFTSPIMKPYLGQNTVTHSVCNAQGDMVSRKSVIPEVVDENIVSNDNIPEGISELEVMEEEIHLHPRTMAPVQKEPLHTHKSSPKTTLEPTPESIPEPISKPVPKPTPTPKPKPKRKPITEEDIQIAEEAVPIVEEETLKDTPEENEQEEVGFFEDIINTFKGVNKELIESEKGDSDDIFNMGDHIHKPPQQHKHDEDIVEDEESEESEESEEIEEPLPVIEEKPVIKRTTVIKKKAVIPKKKTNIKCVCPQPVCPVMTIQSKDDTFKHYVGLVGSLVLIAIFLIIICHKRK